MQPVTPSSAHPGAQPHPIPPQGVDLTGELCRAGIPVPASHALVVSPVQANHIRALINIITAVGNVDLGVNIAITLGDNRSTFLGALALMQAGLIGGPFRPGSVSPVEWMDRFLQYSTEPVGKDASHTISLTERLSAMAGAGVDLQQPQLIYSAAARRFALQALLTAGANIHTEDSEGLTALHRAACDNNLEAAQSLLACGADPNRISRIAEADTPLMLAAATDHLRMITLLICCGASVHVGPAGRTPLHAAASKGRTGAIYLLLARGANPRARCAAGRTPLHEIAAHPSDDPGSMIAALHRAGADINARTRDGATPLHLCAKTGQLEAVRSLLETGAADIHATDALGRTALHLATSRGHADVVSELMQAGAPLKVRDSQGNSPLTLAPPDLRDRLKATLRATSSTNQPD